jgi:hypothetical protein
MAYIIRMCYLITPSNIARHHHRLRLSGKNGRSSERMRTLEDRKTLKQRLLLISRYLYTKHTTSVTHSNRREQTHTRRVSVSLIYSCRITVTSQPCNLTSYPLFLLPTIQEMELGGGDESDRDRVGTLDPDDAEDSTGKPASDEKDKAGAEEEKEDTPQVSQHPMACYAVTDSTTTPYPHACVTALLLRHLPMQCSSYTTTHVMHQARVLLMLQEKLPECTNKQRCDEFCTSFCYLNSKGARKKLVQALIKLPRSRLDLTSTYSRCSPYPFIVLEYLHCIYMD